MLHYGIGRVDVVEYVSRQCLLPNSKERTQGLYEEDATGGYSVRVACRITVLLVTIYLSFSLALRPAERADMVYFIYLLSQVGHRS